MPDNQTLLRQPRPRREIVCGFVELRETEVEDLERAGGGADDVLGFEIAMDDAAVVRAHERAGDFRRRRRAPARKAAGPRLISTRSVSPSRYSDADEQLSVDLFERVDRRNPGMLQRRCGARLLLQSAPLCLLSGKAWWQRLQCDPSMQPRVLRVVDDAHATAAGDAVDAIETDVLPGA